MTTEAPRARTERKRVWNCISFFFGVARVVLDDGWQGIELCCLYIWVFYC